MIIILLGENFVAAIFRCLAMCFEMAWGNLLENGTLS